MRPTALRLVVSLLLSLSFLQCFSPVFAAERKAPAQRHLKFPTKFSLGPLFVLFISPAYSYPPDSSNVVKQPTCFVCQARGNVTVPGNAYIYLEASYDLVTHPEILRTIDPNVIDCLSFTKIGLYQSLDRIIEPLSHLTGLRRLDIPFTEFTDAQLVPLKSLTKLQALNLNLDGVDGSFLKHMSGLTELRELGLSDCKLLPGAFTDISHFSKLTYLNLVRTEATDQNLADLTKLKDLRSLFFDNARISPRGVKLLLNFKKLNVLELTGCDLKAADLLCLSQLPLTDFHLPHRYSAAEMAMLKKAFPHTNLGLRIREDKGMNDLFRPIK